MSWISRSLKMSDRAATIPLDRLDYQWWLYDLYINTSQAAKRLATLNRLAERLPNDRRVQDWCRFYTGKYDFKPAESTTGTTVAAQS